MPRTADLVTAILKVTSYNFKVKVIMYRVLFKYGGCVSTGAGGRHLTSPSGSSLERTSRHGRVPAVAIVVDPEGVKRPTFAQTPNDKH